MNKKQSIPKVMNERNKKPTPLLNSRDEMRVNQRLAAVTLIPH